MKNKQSIFDKNINDLTTHELMGIIILSGLAIKFVGWSLVGFLEMISLYIQTF